MGGERDGLCKKAAKLPRQSRQAGAIASGGLIQGLRVQHIREIS